MHGATETICFVFREDFRRSADGHESLSKHFGVGQVIWPEEQLADAIEQRIMAADAVDTGVFAGGKVRLLEFLLGADSSWVGKPIFRLDLPSSVVIAAVHHGATTSIPSGQAVPDAGDRVVLMGTRAAMRVLQERQSPTVAGRRVRLVTVIGGGDVGLRLAQHLDTERDIELKVVEHNRARGEMLAATLANANIIEGDGTNLGVLESEGIGRSDVLVSVIDNDERNLLPCLIGRQLGVGLVITRVGPPGNRRLFERVGIDMALSARGFSPNSLSVNGYNNTAVEWIICVFMFLAGASFALQYRALRNRSGAFARDEEFRVYSGVILVATFLVTGFLWQGEPGQEPFGMGFVRLYRF